MSARRLLAIWRRVIHEIRRDRPSLALLFVAPIIITGLVAFILREGQPAEVKVTLVNDAGPAGTAIAQALDRALRDQGVIITTATDDAAARAAVENGTATVAVILPADMAATVAGGGRPTLVLLTRGLDAAADGSQLGTLQKALSGAVADMLGAGSRLPNVEHRTVYGSPDADMVSNLAPAIVGFFAYFFVYILTGVSFLRERTGGTLERLLATPVTRGEIVGGYALGFGMFATIQVAILLLWALGNLQVPAIGPLPAFSIGLNIPMAGSPVLAFVVVVLLALGSGQPGDLPVHVRPHGAADHPVHPHRARAAVPAVGRALPGQLPALGHPAAGRADAPELRGRRAAPGVHQGGRPWRGRAAGGPRRARRHRRLLRRDRVADHPPGGRLRRPGGGAAGEHPCPPTPRPIRAAPVFPSNRSSRAGHAAGGSHRRRADHRMPTRGGAMPT